MSPRRHQAGQALLLALLLGLSMVFLTFFVFSTGQQLVSKRKLTAAADAAALSAATWRARALNYVAYTNRAIVAQEVAIAQAVTLDAWAQYLETLSTQAAVLSAGLPPVSAALSASASIAAAGREATRAASQLEILLRGDPIVGYKAAIEQSQAAMLRSAQTFGLGAVANEVVRASDPRFFAFALSDGGSFAAFTRRYDTDADRQRLAGVVLASLDPFTAQARNLDLRLLPLPSSCVGRSLNPDSWTYWYRKRSATVLSADLQRWEAIETGSLHDWRARGWLGLGGCRDTESVPLAWGSAVAGSDGDRRDFSSEAWSVNPASSATAVGALSTTHGGSGIARVYDLNYEAIDDVSDPRSEVAVLASMDRSGIHTADRVGSGADRLRLRDSPGKLYALSVAEVYFAFPPGESGHAQLPSLYAPFWHARLAQPTPEHRSAAERYVR